MPSPQKKLLFSHVPKAAGTTLGRILKKNLGSRFYAYYGLYDRYMFDSRDVERILEFAPQYDALASHLISLDLPWRSEKFSIFAVAFVRDPIDRAISLFYYLQKIATERGGLIEGDINSFFRRILKSDCEQRGPYCDAQWHFLQGTKQVTWSFEQLQRLVESGKLIIAPMERFNDACVVMEKVHGDLLSDMAYPEKQNTSPRSGGCSEDVLELLNSKNQKDSQLYGWVQEQFHRQFEHLIGPLANSARLDFQHRCKAVSGDWIADDSAVALNREERQYFEYLKEENRKLRGENAGLRSARDLKLLNGIPSSIIASISRMISCGGHTSKRLGSSSDRG